ncbi:MAG: metal-dependent hydrolase, partial [Flavobacteriales bacterium]|nr:metal-dependent hydrolase [Flavobacteriales bacterium]
MRVTFYGHSTFLFELAGSRLLMDPFFSDNPACDTDPMTVECDYMLLTHGHMDHVQDAVSIAKRTGCTVVANYEVATWVKGQGVENVVELNHGGSARMGDITVKCVNAVHSSVLPDGTYGGNPVGFILKSGDTEFYYAGDTALTMDMELIGRYHDLNAAFLPIGDTYTMGVEDGAIAAEMAGAD